MAWASGPKLLLIDLCSLIKNKMLGSRLSMVRRCRLMHVAMLHEMRIFYRARIPTQLATFAPVLLRWKRILLSESDLNVTGKYTELHCRFVVVL
jgi:hypothetical protein